MRDAVRRRRQSGAVFPDAARTRAAFASLETLAVIDVLPTETTALATHVLPAVDSLERADLPWLLDTYQLAVATQFTPAMVAPVAERWPVWRMFAELGERLGIDVLGGGLTAATATDEKLLQPLAKRSRGGADAVFAARRGVVASGAVFGWVPRPAARRAVATGTEAFTRPARRLASRRQHHPTGCSSSRTGSWAP